MSNKAVGAVQGCCRGAEEQGADEGLGRGVEVGTDLLVDGGVIAAVRVNVLPPGRM